LAVDLTHESIFRFRAGVVHIDFAFGNVVRRFGYEYILLWLQRVRRSDRNSLRVSRLYFNGARTGRLSSIWSCGHVEI